MKLESHVGGLSIARKTHYLTLRGWLPVGDDWALPPTLTPVKLARAVHHQLTADLCAQLAPHGWTVVEHSQRGYAKLADPLDGSTCSLPAALRRQARREKRPVRELTYALFLDVLLQAQPHGPTTTSAGSG